MCKYLAKAVRVRGSEDMAVVVTYVSRGMSAKKAMDMLEETYSHRNPATIIFGDRNARDMTWDNITNDKGTALTKFARFKNLVVTPPKLPLFRAKGRKGDRKPDLLIARMKVEVVQPVDKT